MALFSYLLRLVRDSRACYYLLVLPRELPRSLRLLLC